jgi:hypothetical protein
VRLALVLGDRSVVPYRRLVDSTQLLLVTQKRAREEQLQRCHRQRKRVRSTSAPAQSCGACPRSSSLALLAG